MATDKHESVVTGRIKYCSFNTLYTNGSLINKKGVWEFSLFTDVITSQGEVLPYTDEKGKELDLQKIYKGISAVLLTVKVIKHRTV